MAEPNGAPTLPEVREGGPERVAAPEERARPERQRKVLIGLLAVIAIVLAAAALQATYVVTMPIVFAFFLTLLMHPVQVWLEDRLPAGLRWLGLVLTMALIVAIVALIGGGLWLSIVLVAEEAPRYADRLQEMWGDATGWLEQQGLPVPEPGEDGMFAAAAQYLAAAVLSVWMVVGYMVLIFFFVLLMLIEASAWRRKTRAALTNQRTAVVLDTVDSIATKVRHFLLVKTVTSAASAIFAGVWLWLMGVDFALVWAMLTFLLNYIPNVGSVIAVIPPALVALVQFGPWWALFIVASLAVGEQFLGNYLDPKLQGRTLHISPLVVLISVVFWGWLWGAVGALLAVPITATIIIVCEHVPALRPVVVMLGGADEEAALADADA